MGAALCMCVCVCVRSCIPVDEGADLSTRFFPSSSLIALHLAPWIIM